jgi:RecA/RadA recombinase
MTGDKMANKYEAFFKSYSDTEEIIDFRLAHETIGDKRPVISTGSYAVDDALSSGGLPKGRLIQYYGPPGCHAKGQKILMADGSVKNVEEIDVGDLLMGDNAFPRKVVKLIRGKGKMYKISPKKGKSFIVNEDHVLTLVRNNDMLDICDAPTKFELIDVTVKEYLTWKKYIKHAHKLIRTGTIQFWKSENEQLVNELLIPPYILGILIGDGSLLRSIELTTADQEILNEFTEFTIKSKLRLVEGSKSSKSQTYRAAGDRFQKNDVFSIIKDLGLNVKSGDKFIPSIYKTSSYDKRLELLAGLIDTDGSVSKNCIDYVSKSEILANDVAFVAKSVGLAAYVKECQKSAHKDHIGTYYRVTISGHTDIIPTKLPRKKSSIRQQKKNVLHTGFEITEIDYDDFYGFTITDNGRYLLDDFTITHNSGKTMMAMIAMAEAQKEDAEAQQVFIDAEQSFDPNWAETLGVDTSRVILIDGETAAIGRTCFEMILGVPKEDAKTHEYVGKKKEGLLDKIVSKEFNINLIVLDSLGSIQPPGEDTSPVGKSNMALMARFLSTTFKKLSLDVNKAKIPFIVINHKKDTMDPYGADHTFSGGNSYAHFLSANVYFEAIQRKDAQILDEKENKVGHSIRATIEKSKFGPWPRKCEFKVNFGIGVIDKHEEIAQLSVDYNVIIKSSSVTHEYGDKKWVGFPKLCEAIKEDPKFAEELVQKITTAREQKAEQKRKEQADRKTVSLEGAVQDKMSVLMSDKIKKVKKES